MVSGAEPKWLDLLFSEWKATVQSPYEIPQFKAKNVSLQV